MEEKYCKNNENTCKAMINAINKWKQQDGKWGKQFGEPELPLKIVKLNNGFKFNARTKSVFENSPKAEEYKLIKIGNKIQTLSNNQVRNEWAKEEFIKLFGV